MGLFDKAAANAGAAILEQIKSIDLSIILDSPHSVEVVALWVLPQISSSMAQTQLLSEENKQRRVKEIVNSSFRISEEFVAEIRRRRDNNGETNE